MNALKLTKRNVLIALAINFSLMAVSYRMGFCLNVAIPCTLVWMGMMAVAYLRQGSRLPGDESVLSAAQSCRSSSRLH